MIGINKIPFLSICIPTYNRAEHVLSLVKEIFLCQSDEIEIIVLDNCSTDKTKELLSNIDDKRLVYIQNPFNIGAVQNLIKVLTLANGKYALLCLDRDYMESQYIPSLIESLREDNDVVWGYCSYGLKESGKDVKFEAGFASVLNMSYLSNHPSGEFYNTDILKRLKIIKEVKHKYSKFSFCHELLNAEISFFGSSKRIFSPVITAAYSNSKEDFASNKTYSFSKNNFYFMPAQRIVEFSTYIIHASWLNLSSKEKRSLINAIYLRGLIASTYEYRKNLNDPYFCAHYRLETRKVSLFELIKCDFYFLVSFLRQNILLSKQVKIFICLNAHFKLCYYLLRNIYKRI